MTGLDGRGSTAGRRNSRKARRSAKERAGDAEGGKARQDPPASGSETRATDAPTGGLDRADKTGHHISRALSNQTLMERGRAAWALARSSLPPVHFARFAIADEQKKVAESEELVIEHHDEFAKAIKDIRSDMSSTDWCLVGYKDTTVLRMIGAGQGGLNALLDTAEPFGVNYGVLRVSEKLDLVYHEAYCFITWMPENVPAFVKARVSIHQGAVAAAFRQHVHCQFFFREAEREDITLDIIRARVRQIIGKDGYPK